MLISYSIVPLFSYILYLFDTFVISREREREREREEERVGHYIVNYTEPQIFLTLKHFRFKGIFLFTIMVGGGWGRE